MYNLFWKIFLSFWLSFVLFAAASMFAASHYLDHMHARNDTETPRERYLTHLEDARAIAGQHGLAGLIKWSKQVDQSQAVPHLLIDTSGKELLERPLSPNLVQRLERRFQVPVTSERRQKWWNRGKIMMPDDSEYRLIRDYQGVTLGRVLSRPKVLAIPLLVAGVISGLACFLLAQYLTRPIQRLSRATKQFAVGNLDQRVTPSMGGRKDEIAELAHDFDHMAERLHDLVRSHKQLLSDVSHELRSPLARLQVATGLARQRENGRDNPEIDRIEREAERLNELIGQLLTLAQFETGGIRPETLTIELEDLVAEVAENAEYEASANNRHARLVKTMPALIEVDTTLMCSALENVVRNGIRYTKEGSTVEIALVPCQKQPKWVEILVTDHGPGVPEEMLSELFEPFVRVSDARDHESGGYGLGLAITKRIISLHGGEVSATNAACGGLEVKIRLPLAQPI